MERKGDWIETYTGKQFYVLDPRPEDICIEDIAHSLSLTCRFNGHCKIFFSVAQHCLNIVEDLKNKGYSNQIQLYGLLHDAGEAYISDVPRPVKKSIEGFEYIEDSILDKIWIKFNLDNPTQEDWKIIKDIDSTMCFFEGLHLTNHINDWIDKFYIVDITNRMLFYPDKSSKEIEEEYLEAFNNLISA